VEAATLFGDTALLDVVVILVGANVYHQNIKVLLAEAGCAYF